MPGRTHTVEETRIAEEAAEWLAIIESGDPEKHARFSRWIAESPLHLREFLLISSLDNELRRLGPQSGAQREEILSWVSANILPLPTSTAHSSAIQTRARNVSDARAGATRGWRLVAAAAVVILVAIGTRLIVTRESRGYSTAVGEQREIQLTDGSIVYLNTKSRIRAIWSAHLREIHLMEGEALFKVQHDAARPFRVFSGRNVIQAVGTQFDVDQRPSATLVSVIEGQVQISSVAAARGPQQERAQLSGAEASADSPTSRLVVRLSAGEEARIGLYGDIQRRNAVDPISIATWRQHRLVFHDDALEDIIAAFNRHNVSTQIRLDGAEVRSRRYTAVFDADDPLSLVAFLHRDRTLQVIRAGQVFVVQSASVDE